MAAEFSFWHGRRVFLTGHTGFKGAWMSLVLSELGAEVYGFALPSPDPAGLFLVTSLAECLHHQIGDVRDLRALQSAVAEARPSIVVHMAAQAVVRTSYQDPVGTYATNIMGTVHILEAVRHTPGVDGVVVVTSDKCYENTNAPRAYRETDRLGGHDPYSSSKGAAELVTDAFRKSFFAPGKSSVVASARAGNVVGGGDWANDRLVPDAMRAFTEGRVLRIRNPGAVRPWQHVLDAIFAYLTLAERSVTVGDAFGEGWNFGPGAASEVPVGQIINRIVHMWGGNARWEMDTAEHMHESDGLRLDCSKAERRLGWRPTLGLEESLRMTVEWYKAQSAGEDMRELTLRQIRGFLDRRALLTRSEIA